MRRAGRNETLIGVVGFFAAPLSCISFFFSASASSFRSRRFLELFTLQLG